METKHTKCEWFIQNDPNDYTITAKTDDYDFVAIIPNHWNNAKANAKLIAETGTVANECGLTPRQLLNQRNELLKACENLENDDNLIPEHAWNLIQIAIKKATE